MRDIDERGMREVMAEALRFASDDTAGIAVSLDMDFVDPSDAPGVGTPVRGGVTYREAHLALEMIADSKAHGVVRAGRNQSGDRFAQYDRDAGRGAGAFRPGEENPVSVQGTKGAGETRRYDEFKSDCGWACCSAGVRANTKFRWRRLRR